MSHQSLHLIALSVMLFIASVAFGESVPLYGRFEKAFEAGREAKAFIDLDAEFMSPSGEKVTRPGFYDGGRTYRVRFMPLEEGNWNFVTRSEAAGLGGQRGIFECRKIKSANRFLKHGPLRVSKDGRHLEHFDGTPFFFLADTVWNGPLLSKKDHWDTFIEDRVAKHFTGIQFVMLSPWRTAPTNAEGLVGFTGKKDVTINPEFYKRIDERMGRIESAGLLSIPVLMWAWGKQDAGQALPEADAIKVIRYQVARYGAHPVVWILNGDGNYQGEIAERWKRIGRAVFAEKVGAKSKLDHHAPVTLHPGGRKWPYEDFRDEKWVDIYGYQSSHSVGGDTLKWIHSGPMAAEWDEEPVKPYINLEPCYEAHLSGRTVKITDAHVRQACWYSMLSTPPAGLTYGGHGIWSWQEEDGLPFDHHYTGMAKRWQDAKDLPGAGQMKHLIDFFTSVNWTDLRPALDLVVEQPGKSDPTKWIAAATSKKGNLVVAYLPAGGKVKLAIEADGRRTRAEWYDPRTGKRSAARAAGDHAFQAPDDRDWVLVLKP